MSIPFLGALCLVELALTRVRRRDYYPAALDTIASLTSGLWNLTIAGTGLIFAFVSYEWMEAHLHVVQLGSTMFAAAIAFVVLDFGSYWLHRAAHTYNFLWQTHVVHHTSEELNLAVALRNGGTPISFRFLVLAPLAVLGVAPKLVFLLGGVQLVATIWYHTRFLRDLGPVGKVLVTPSQHRVHHGINPIYLDRNFGAIFSVWDRLFGTYQPELDHEPAVFGLTRPARTYNPLTLDYRHWGQMLEDAARTSSRRDKVHIWFSRTNWRPADVSAANPIVSLAGEEERASYVKFRPYADRPAIFWSWAEMVMQTALTAGLFWLVYQETIVRADVLWYSSFLVVSIVTYTTAMDGRRHVGLASLRLAYASVLVVTAAGTDWFGLGAATPLAGAASVVVLVFGAVGVVMSVVAKRAPAPPLSVAEVDVASVR